MVPRMNFIKYQYWQIKFDCCRIEVNVRFVCESHCDSVCKFQKL